MNTLGRHALAVAWWCCGVMATATVSANDGKAAPGEYLFRAAGCAGCHTDVDHNGPDLAGGRRFQTDFGIFYSPNITSDPDTGIGRWTLADFKRALREGIGPDGAHYFPAFPYPAYTRLSETDITALWEYLSRRPPVRQTNKPHELPWYLRSRLAAGVWKWLFFTPGAFHPRSDQTNTWNRGAYLVTAVAHCGECHTPRNRLGALLEARAYSGNPRGVDDAVIPNITPHPKTGIGRWSESDIAYYLETGMTPDGDFAGDAMAEVIDNSTSMLSREDRRAIASYLKSLPAIESVQTDRDRDQKRKPRQKEPWE